MILIVDDDGTLLETVQEVLEDAGFSVAAFTDPRSALEAAQARRPELVVCDVRMPGMDGFQFQEELKKVAQGVPFVFLSSVGDPEVQVRGLEAGADDYITKPIDFRLLVAKVRAVLRRRPEPEGATFTGDLSKVSFVDVLRFCEKRGFTGEVHVQGPGVDVYLRVEGGQPAEDDETLDALDQALTLTEGTFQVRVAPLDFGEMAHARVEERAKKRPEPVPCPVGRLGGFRMGSTFVQVQTECVASPEPAVVSMAVADGRILVKETEPVPAGASRAELADMVRRRHAEFERKVALELRDGKGAGRTEAPMGAGRDEEARLRELMDQGLDALKQRDFEGAFRAWSQAVELDPDNKVLETNLAMLKKKLGRDEP